MSYSNYSVSLSATSLASSVGTPMGSAFDNLRAARDAETDSGRQEAIGDVISDLKNAMRGINDYTGEPHNAGVKPMSGSTPAFTDISSVSGTATYLQNNIDPLIQTLGASSASAVNATSNQTVRSYLTTACTNMQDGLAGWCSALSQASGTGVPSGGWGKGDHH